MALARSDQRYFALLSERYADRLYWYAAVRPLRRRPQYPRQLPRTECLMQHEETQSLPDWLRHTSSQCFLDESGDLVMRNRLLSHRWLETIAISTQPTIESC